MLRFYRYHTYLVAALFALAGNISFYSSSFAMDAVCVDSDGDGYGWNGIETCNPNTVNDAISASSTTNNCEYTNAHYNDGWGWDPVARRSCEPVMSTSISTENNESQTTATVCEDSDGDGWGWDSQRSCRAQTTELSCIDTDGDGWGWDGTQTCIATDEATITTEASAEFTPLESDPVWPFCEEGNSRHQLNFGESWGTVEDTRRLTDCVRQCSTNATELPTVTRWGYDSDAGAECLYDNAPDDLTSHAIPIYDPTTSSRIEFQDQFAFHLYSGGSSNWQCSLETRPSNQEPFMPNGDTSSFVFSDNDGKWRFATAFSRRILQIKNDPGQTDFDYIGYALIDHNQLMLYRHSLERLKCTADNPELAFQLPDNVQAVDQLPAVALAELLSRTLSCRTIESMSRSQNTDWSFGYSSDGAAGVESPLTLNFDSIDQDLNQTYRFNTQLNDWQDYLYTQSNDTFRHFQTTGTSSSSSNIRFKNLGTHFLAEKLDRCFISGGCADEITYAVCQ